jgi:DNA-directed RNA polymerase subunit RPC12/RpoP
MEPVVATCSGCGLQAKVPATSIGKTVRCPRCGTRFAVPPPAAEAPAPAAEAPAPAVEAPPPAVEAPPPAAEAPPPAVEAPPPAPAESPLTNLDVGPMPISRAVTAPLAMTVPPSVGAPPPAEDPAPAGPAATVWEEMPAAPRPTEVEEPTAPRAVRLPAGREWQVGDVVLDLYEVTAILGEGGMGASIARHRGRWTWR